MSHLRYSQDRTGYNGTSCVKPKGGPICSKGPESKYYRFCDPPVLSQMFSSAMEAAFGNL